MEPDEYLRTAAERARRGKAEEEATRLQADQIRRDRVGYTDQKVRDVIGLLRRFLEIMADRRNPGLIPEPGFLQRRILKPLGWRINDRRCWLVPGTDHPWLSPSGEAYELGDWVPMDQYVHRMMFAEERESYMPTIALGDPGWPALLEARHEGMASGLVRLLEHNDIYEW